MSLFDIEAMQLEIGRICLNLIRKLCPSVYLTRNECIGVMGGWDIKVKWFCFVFIYRSTDLELRESPRMKVLGGRRGLWKKKL
jgi:hypothetical protein